MADLRYNQLDTESATMLATIAKEKKISLCGIAPDQTSANFYNMCLGKIDSILIASDLHVRASLTEVSVSMPCPFASHAECGCVCCCSGRCSF